MALFLFLLSFSLNASVLQDEIKITDKAEFNVETVCRRMVKHESPLIDVVSGTELDCMGKRVKVSDFCEQEMASDPYYLRAYADKIKQKVICVSGKKVFFKYQCVKLADKQLCQQDPKKSCHEIREKLAKRLDLIHSSVLANEKGIKVLTCLFESLPLNEKRDGTL